MTLDGLESAVKNACPMRRKVNVVRYADDFIVTADKQPLIQETIIPAINEFLSARGLQLSPEKTSIVRIEHGFDFLGQRLRKFGNKLITTPSKESMKSFLAKVRETIKRARSWGVAQLIAALNPIIRGWCQYHKYVQSSRAFSYANGGIFKALWHWARKRHPAKSAGWIKKKYFNHASHAWVLCCRSSSHNGNTTSSELFMPSFTKLVRYIKVKAESNPFNPTYTNYFDMRKALSNTCTI
jgi:RNA-directed DNA polymerase